MTKAHSVPVHRFIKNLTSNWLALLVEVGIAFYLTPFIVKHLGLSTYGVWSLLNGLVGYLGLIDMGIRGGTGRYINLYLAKGEPDKVNQVISTSVVFLTILSILVVGIASLLANYFLLIFPKTPSEMAGDISNVLVIMSANLWLAFLLAVYRGFINALERYDINNGIAIVFTLLRSFGILYVLDHGFGLKEMALVTTFANFFSLPFLLIAGKKLYPQLKLFSFGIHKERFLEIFKFGMGVFIARGGGQLNAYSHQLIIMWVLGPKFLGVFEMAMLLINNSIKLLETTQHVLYPRITKAGGLKDIASLRDIFLWQAKLTFFIGIGLFIGFIVYGKAFLDLWLGEHGQEAVSLLSIFSLAMLLSLFSSVSKMVLFGLGKVKVNIVFEYSYAIIEVILILVGLQLFGKSLEVFAFVALLDMSIGRGLIYTSFAIKQIKINAVKYFLFFGFRVLLCSMTTYWAFTEIHRFIAFQSWYGFFQSIIICVGLYVVIAIFTLLKISELKIVTGKLFNYA